MTGPRGDPTFGKVRYIDSGSRDPDHALGTWLSLVLDDQVAALRLQSGYLSADGIAFLAGALQHLAARAGLAHAVVGSNDGITAAGDVRRLAALLGLPRTGGSRTPRRGSTSSITRWWISRR